MSNILKKMCECIIILVAIILLVDYTGELLNPEWTDGAMRAVEAFHSIPEKSAEVIIYGSSHAWKGVETMEMYKEYGIAGYNYGCNWQHINTTNLFLQDSFRTQSPKVVLIETYRAANVLEDTDMNGEIYYSKEISFFDGKAEYLKQCFGNELGRYISYCFPLVIFHERWNDIYLENFWKGSKENYITTMGYEGSASSEPAEISDCAAFEQKELGEKPVKVLDDMVRLCHENGAEVIFFTVPYQGVNEYAAAMKTYAESKGCVYLDLFEKIDEIGIDGNTDFRDAGHLNDSGARKVANYLGKYIVDNYDVVDMRKIEDNMWEKQIKKE